MNKKLIIKILFILIIVIVLGVLSVAIFYDSTTISEQKFKKEYECLNNKKNDNGKKYLNISIPKDNNIKYASFAKVMEFLDNGTGILYLGFPECPWCRNAVPVLIDTALDEEIENIYYFNALSIRDIKELDDSGKIITTKKGTKEYYKLVDKLKDVLGPYKGLNDENIKRIYFPTVVFIMGGKIVGIHIGTVDSQKDPYIKLSKKQKSELKKIYTKNINKIYGTCDENC